MRDALYHSGLKNENIHYVGLDLHYGDNVDVIYKPNMTWPFESDDVFDVIISSSTFEHMDFFWEMFLEMAASLKSNGFMLVSVPSNQEIHRYPIDSWRFYPDAAYSLARWAKRHGHNLEVLYSHTICEYDTVMIFWKTIPTENHINRDSVILNDDKILSR
jgi:SAM-dependent methyltransferase